MRKWYFLFLLALCLTGYRYYLDFMTDGFKTAYIKTHHEGAHLENSADVTDLLNQKFHYLKKGSQSFVFLGEDQTTVLKFFRCNRYKTFLPSLFQKKNTAKQEKWDNLIKSCVIAHNELREESALLFVKLEKSFNLPRVIVEDRLGRTHKIDLNNTYFVLQKKAQLLYPFLLECKNSQTIDEACKGLSSIVKLIQFRLTKGIGDYDSGLAKNMGLIGTTPCFLDIGQFYHIGKQNPEEQKAEVRKIAAKLNSWVFKNYEEFYPFFAKSTYMAE